MMVVRQRGRHVAASVQLCTTTWGPWDTEELPRERVPENPFTGGGETSIFGESAGPRRPEGVKGDYSVVFLRFRRPLGRIPPTVWGPLPVVPGHRVHLARTWECAHHGTS